MGILARKAFAEFIKPQMDELKDEMRDLDSHSPDMAALLTEAMAIIDHTCGNPVDEEDAEEKI